MNDDDNDDVSVIDVNVNNDVVVDYLVYLVNDYNSK